MAILRRKLRATQWGALLVLLVGVAMVQLVQTEPSKTTATTGPEQIRFVGFSAALAACFLSGFAGIYFEKILKVRYFSQSLLAIIFLSASIFIIIF